jgi:hypothetical protein
MLVAAMVLGVSIGWPAHCAPEGETPLEGVLDGLWEEAKVIAHRPGAALPRPRFCVGPRPLWHGEARILGGYDAGANAVALMLTPGELPEFGRCVALHEMLHALLGPHMERVVRAAAPCAIRMEPDGGLRLEPGGLSRSGS